MQPVPVPEIPQPADDGAQKYITMILELHTALSQLPTLEPSPRVNSLFGKLVDLCAQTLDESLTAKVSCLPPLRPERPSGCRLMQNPTDLDRSPHRQDNSALATGMLRRGKQARSLLGGPNQWNPDRERWYVPNSSMSYWRCIHITTVSERNASPIHVLQQLRRAHPNGAKRHPFHRFRITPQVCLHWIWTLTVDFTVYCRFARRGWRPAPFGHPQHRPRLACHPTVFRALPQTRVPRESDAVPLHRSQGRKRRFARLRRGVCGCSRRYVVGAKGRYHRRRRRPDETWCVADPEERALVAELVVPGMCFRTRLASKFQIDSTCTADS